MTRPTQLEIGDRVQFWRTFPSGKFSFQSTNLKRELDHMCPGTVVSVDPLRVLWDRTAMGDPHEYPLDGPNESYHRSCIRKLPPYAQRSCDNCLYGDATCPRDGTMCSLQTIAEHGSLHKWRPVE